MYPSVQGTKQVSAQAQTGKVCEGGEMLIQYIPFMILVFIALVFVIASLALARFVGTRHPTPKKVEPYESGMVPIGTTKGRFPIRFYLVAILFILFDVEIVFLYPWAVIMMNNAASRIFLFAELAVFIAVLAVGYIYVWRRGALDWE